MDLLLSYYHTMVRHLVHGDYFLFGFELLMLLMAAGVVLTVLYGIFHVLDTAFVPTQTTDGAVVGRYRVDGWTQPINNVDGIGNVTGVTYIDHPPQFLIQVSGRDVSGEINVGPDAYDNYREGQRVTIWFRIGRLGGSRYVTAIGRR